MKKIAVIGGDGTGPEVVAEATKVLKHLQGIHSFQLDLKPLPYNGTRYIEEGTLLTDAELDHLKTYDAILLGAIGHPDVKPGILERGILLKLRFGLDQYINLRPVKLYENVASPLKNKTPDDIDYVVVRENTGDVYTGMGGVMMKDTPHEVATQTMIYTRHQVERCLKFAFEYTLKRHKNAPWKGLSEAEKAAGFVGKITLCGKSNVLTHVFDLWERTLADLSKAYPTIKTDYVHVDAVCIYMIECPERFDTIVTTNMFGDIITDLAAVTQGGMGVAPSGNINPEGVSMFEPIGGTAPAFTGKNEINPIACISAAQLMLAHLGFEAASVQLEGAIQRTVMQMKSMAAAQMGFSTSEIGDLVCKELSGAQ
ncbi:MAG: 3-isopropylmalate dehydrogenase [Candidatus Margulisiibacteriota bacterium]